MTFTVSQLLALLPLLLTTGAMVALMLAIAWKRCDDTAFVVTIIGLNLALFSLPIVMAQGDQGVTPLLQVDAYAVFYMGLVLIGALATCTFGRTWLKGYPDNREEFYLLLLIATALHAQQPFDIVITPETVAADGTSLTVEVPASAVTGPVQSSCPLSSS